MFVTINKIVCIAFSVLFILIPFRDKGSTDVDSLKRLLSTEKADSTRLKILVELSNVCDESEILSWSGQALTLSKKLKNSGDKSVQVLVRQSMASSLNNMGFAHMNAGNIELALNEYMEALEIRKNLKDIKGMGESYVNIGYLFEQKGLISKAVENYESGLKASESAGDKSNMSYALNNLGFINQNQGYYDKAAELYGQSLKIREELKDDFGIAQSLTNVGAIYKLQKKLDAALDCHQRALKIQERIGDKSGASNSLNNIGFIYQQQRFFPLALSCYQKSLEIRRETGEKKGISTSLCNIGTIFLEQGLPDKALLQGTEAYEIARSLGYPGKIRDAALLLKNVYKSKGDYKKAFEMDEIYIVMKDSLMNEETRKMSARQHLRYEYEKKAAADSVKKAEYEKLHKMEMKNKELEVKRSRIWVWFMVFGLSFLLVGLVFVISRYRHSQKQNRIIELQKAEVEKQKIIVEEKQKEIVDSITYAKRIQDAMLRHESLLENHFSGHFIFFKPRDIVSGDFYWFAEKDQRIFFALADCTGHGVPGGFMSMLGISLLNEIVIEKNMDVPCEILDTMKLKLIHALKQNDTAGENKDGMDMILCVLDKKTRMLSFSCANNPLWMVRNSQMREFHPDKQPVGMHMGETKQFTHNEVMLMNNDQLYLVTDGFPDQFGGPKGKKFKYKPLKELLIRSSEMKQEDQKHLLEDTLNKWQNFTADNGSQIKFEQVDDISIIGIKI